MGYLWTLEGQKNDWNNFDYNHFFDQFNKILPSPYNNLNNVDKILFKDEFYAIVIFYKFGKVIKFIQHDNLKFSKENKLYLEAKERKMEYLFAKNTMFSEFCTMQDFYPIMNLNLNISDADKNLIWKIYSETGYRIRNQKDEAFFEQFAYLILKGKGKQELIDVCKFFKEFHITDITPENIRLTTERLPILIDY